jgi:hypothetical protein
MSDGRHPPEPSELVYVPEPSWLPVLAAAGVAGLVVGLFVGWPYAVVGAILLLASLRAWVRRTGDDVARLPREQRLTTAVLPAVPLRGPGASPARPAAADES